MEREILNQIAKLVGLDIPEGELVLLNELALVGAVKEAVDSAEKYKKIKELLR